MTYNQGTTQQNWEMCLLLRELRSLGEGHSQQVSADARIPIHSAQPEAHTTPNADSSSEWGLESQNDRLLCLFQRDQPSQLKKLKP